jgi:hypothetical protein
VPVFSVFLDVLAILCSLVWLLAALDFSCRAGCSVIAI